MSPYYIKEIRFSNGELTIVIGDANDDSWSMIFKPTADDLMLLSPTKESEG